MPPTVYQANFNVNDVAMQPKAFEVIASVALNAVEGYGLTVQDVSMNAGRLRIRLSDALPPEEVATFGGTIIVV